MNDYNCKLSAYGTESLWFQLFLVTNLEFVLWFVLQTKFYVLIVQKLLLANLFAAPIWFLGECWPDISPVLNSEIMVCCLSPLSASKRFQPICKVYNGLIWKFGQTWWICVTMSFLQEEKKKLRVVTPKKIYIFQTQL